MTKPKVPIKNQIGTLFQPKNLLKTVASQVPIASAGVEMLNQLEGKQTETRISALEEADSNLVQKLAKLETAVADQPPPNPFDWSAAVNEYLQRNAEIAISYTLAGEDAERILSVAHGCLVGDDMLLTCKEAMDLANHVAKTKGGRIVMVFGLTWYEIQPEPVDELTGLVLCRIGERNEEQWEAALKIFDHPGMRQLVQSPTKIQPKWTISPWLGQECGFIIRSDSEDNVRQAEMSHVEIGTSVISHFKMPRDFGLKVFVSAVFAGRMSHPGSAVFSRDGTLLGIISDVEKYEYDAGRRLVVKTLLGLPRFTAPKLKPADQITSTRNVAVKSRQSVTVTIGRAKNVNKLDSMRPVRM